MINYNDLLTNKQLTNKSPFLGCYHDILVLFSGRQTRFLQVIKDVRKTAQEAAGTEPLPSSTALTLRRIRLLALALLHSELDTFKQESHLHFNARELQSKQREFQIMVHLLL